MPNGNYLVASMFPNNGSVREIDRNTGGDVWSKPFRQRGGGIELHKACHIISFMLLLISIEKISFR